MDETEINRETVDEEEEVVRRPRKPQSLNQKNAKLLQDLARLRAQRLSSSTPLQQQQHTQENHAEKKADKVKLEGRRRLCKVSHASADDDTISSSIHEGERDVDFGDSASANSERPEEMSAFESKKEKKDLSVAQISSKLDSLSIRNCKDKRVSQSSESGIEVRDSQKSASEVKGNSQELSSSSTGAAEFESATSALSSTMCDDDDADFCQSKFSAFDSASKTDGVNTHLARTTPRDTSSSHVNTDGGRKIISGNHMSFLHSKAKSYALDNLNEASDYEERFDLPGMSRRDILPGHVKIEANKKITSCKPESKSNVLDNLNEAYDYGDRFDSSGMSQRDILSGSMKIEANKKITSCKPEILLSSRTKSITLDSTNQSPLHEESIGFFKTKISHGDKNKLVPSNSGSISLDSSDEFVGHKEKTGTLLSRYDSLLSLKTSYLEVGNESEDGSDSECGDTVSHTPSLADKDGSNMADITAGKTADLILTNGGMSYKLPSKINNYLYPHQRECINWLWVLHCKSKGGILGDDMGLGKTMQACAFLAGLFTFRLIKRALIVAPKTVLPNWSKELSIVGLAGRTKDFSGNPGSTRDYALRHILQAGGVLLTTYDVVRNNWKALRGDYHGRDGYGDTSDEIVTWDYIILDEGHIIKNPTTQRAKSLREIPSSHRIILSGTPIQNNLKEMWALFDFCCPGLLGDHKEFKAKYENLILEANDKRATQRQKWVGSKAAEELRERIQPYFMRRLKSEVFPDTGDSLNKQIAKKDDIIVWLKLTEIQRKLYTAFLQSERAISSVEGSALAALTVLKKICDHPALLTKRATEDIAEGMETLISGAGDVESEEMFEEVAALEERVSSLVNLQDSQNEENCHANSSCKIAFVIGLLEQLMEEKHRVLIFSQTRKMLNIIQEEVRKKGYDFFRIDGTTKALDREKLVNEFQSSERVPIFLLTSKVGGLGITLTGADRVIIVDPAWNPSTDNQSVDRAYRIGQLRNVLVYRLMTCGTIEEKIYRKQVFKGGLFRTATEQKQQTRYFSKHELHELFSIPDSGFDVSLTQQQLHEEHDKQHKIDDSLRQHIEFLEDLGIAGVNHHNLLYSKTETVQAPPQEECDIPHWKYTGATSRYAPAKVSNDVVSNGSAYAFKPQDYTSVRHETVQVTNEFSFQEAIRERIKRVDALLKDKDMISRLPDKGENLRRKKESLTSQLTSTGTSSSVSNNKISTEISSISTGSDRVADIISPMERSINSSHTGENFQKKRDLVVRNADVIELDNNRSSTKEKHTMYSSGDSSGVIDIDNLSNQLGKLDVHNSLD